MRVIPRIHGLLNDRLSVNRCDRLLYENRLSLHDDLRLLHDDRRSHHSAAIESSSRDCSVLNHDRSWSHNARSWSHNNARSSSSHNARSSSSSSSNDDRHSLCIFESEVWESRMNRNRNILNFLFLCVQILWRITAMLLKDIDVVSGIFFIWRS